MLEKEKKRKEKKKERENSAKIMEDVQSDPNNGGRTAGQCETAGWRIMAG